MHWRKCAFIYLFIFSKYCIDLQLIEQKDVQVYTSIAFATFAITSTLMSYRGFDMYQFNHDP